MSLITETQIIVALIANAFGAYTIYKFMHIFFDEQKSSKWLEFLSYLLYFCVINFIYIKGATTSILVIGNLALFYFITLNYDATVKRRLISVIFIYLVMAFAEVFVPLLLFFLKYVNVFDYSNSEYILSQFSTKIVIYALILLMRNFKQLGNQFELPTMYWLASIFLPFLSLILIVIIFDIVSRENVFLAIISTTILLAFNGMVFYLYENLIEAYQKQFENQLLLAQNQAYVEQLNANIKKQEDLDILRHDMKHHIVVLQDLLERQENQQALTYLQKMYHITAQIKGRWVQSGNDIVDSILNQKIELAVKEQIEVKTQLEIPNVLAIEAFDLSLILGNLLDNAINAVKQLPVLERHIYLKIIFEHDTLNITCYNPYNGQLRMNRQGELLTTQEDKQKHGKGLKSIDNTLKKYQGSKYINSDNNTFIIAVILYIAESSNSAS